MKNIGKNLLLKILVTVTLISFIVIIYLNSTQEKYTYITQLKNSTSTQMMGYLIKTENGKVIAIDGGTENDTDNFINNVYKIGGKIDYWFITHNHIDHAGVFVNVVNNTKIEIGTVCVSLNDKEWYMENEPNRQEFSIVLINTLNNERIKNRIKSPELNEVFYIDNLKIDILGIRNPEITENSGNEQSMIIKFDTGKTTLLILGDAGEKTSEKLLKTQSTKLKSDIVQVSHHGQSGATRELYAAIKPNICLWPTPEWLWNNDSGEGYNTGTWKTLETRRWMDELGVTKHYVEKDGNVTIKIK